MVGEQELREAFCEIGRRVWQKNFIAANDGNFSYRLDKNRIICTPTMISKGFMKPEDMVVVDLDGNQVSGTRKLTSEIRVHLFIYRERPDIHSVVHVHPPHATAFAVVGRDLPKCVLPEVEVNLGEVPLTPYALTGTWEFAETLRPWVRSHDAFLLRNHGAITTGLDPYDAYYKMETLDQYCRILLLAMQAGDPQLLGAGDMEGLMELKRKAGIRDPRDGGNLCAPPSPPKPDALLQPGDFVARMEPVTDEPKVAPRQKAPDLENVVRSVTDEVMKRLGK